MFCIERNLVIKQIFRALHSHNFLQKNAEIISQKCPQISAKSAPTDIKKGKKGLIRHNPLRSIKVETTLVPHVMTPIKCRASSGVSFLFVPTSLHESPRVTLYLYLQFSLISRIIFSPFTLLY